MNNSEFKKKLSFFKQSLRSSFRDHTASVVLLFFSVFVMTIFSAFCTKGLSEMVYSDIYPYSFSVIDIPDKQQQLILDNFSELTDLSYELIDEYENLEVDLRYCILNQLFPSNNHSFSPLEIMYFLFCNNKYFSAEQISNGEKLIVMSEMLAADYNGSVGSIVNYYGTDYKITQIFPDQDRQKICYIPITAPPSRLLSGSTDFKFKGLGFSNVPEEFYFGGEQKLIDFGLDVPKRSFSLSSSFPLALLIGACILASINIIAVYSYFAKVNGHKYSIFKTLGAKNGNIAAIMIAEVMIIAIAAFGAGLLFDFVISLFLNTYSGNIKLPAIHYSVLIVVNLITVLLSTVFSVVKRARLMPIDRRIW